MWEGCAAVVANVAMTVVYATTVCIGYGIEGEAVAGFLPDSMAAGPARVAVGLLLAFHLLVCYLITAQPLTRAIHAALFPVDYASRLAYERPSGWAQWLLTSLIVLTSALVLAAAVPFFAEFQALLGALTGVPTVCGWPALFLLRGSRRKGARLGTLDRLACSVLMYGLMPLLLVAGSASSIAAIAQKWGSAQANPLGGCSVL